MASRSRVVLGYGDINAKIMFIGLCPGRNGADLTGIPFTKDPSGNLSQDALHRLGLLISRRPHMPPTMHAYVTNIVKCCPKDLMGRNRTPTPEEIKSCLKYVQAEIDIVGPKFIVTLGKVATQCLLGRRIRRLSDIRLTPIAGEHSKVIPMYHPSFVTRGAYSREGYFQDLKRLAALTGAKEG